ncbi:MAG: hypothetical protein DRQ47_01030 [Gammaproteobacteria bacterium]|nr:MAG: hypothetical protein DRQ47_01030 [Gammaproteobacteria bacterium]
MNDFTILFIEVWLLSQIICIVMLKLGARNLNNRLLLKIGDLAYRKKLNALEKVWPLTKIKQLIASKDTLMCTVILSSLILLKSIASLVFGIIMIFWLPLASFIVPSIITIHAPNDQQQLNWIQKVSMLQVTSHSLAAALGFVMFVLGPMAEMPLLNLIQSNFELTTLVSLGSFCFAIAAGKAETNGIIHRGI